MGPPISFTSRKVWTDEPTLSDFVTELSNLYHRPKFMIQVCYAFDAIYFAFVERKLYLLVNSHVHKGWVIGFIHISSVQRNYIPYIQEALHVFCNRRS